MRDPKIVTTSERKKLGDGPADMANQGGGKVPLLSSSTQVPLSRNEHRMANLENRPHQGKIVTTSTQQSLGRNAVPLYTPVSKTSPLISGKGGGRKGR